MVELIEDECQDGSVAFTCPDFNPEHIFECGQAFNWEREDDGSYTFIAYGKVVNVGLEGRKVKLRNTCLEDFENIWYDYFDLGIDYGKIKDNLSSDPNLDEAVKFGYGIRILKQDIYETIISFIISANNRIPMIKNSIRKLSENYGEPIMEGPSRTYFSFPKKEVLARQDPADIRELCRVGFRDKRIVEASKMLASDEFDIDSLKSLPTEELRKKLMALPGVGPKVSDCILLFAFARREVFPVDVWIKRVMEELYIKKTIKKKEVASYAGDIFGDLAGYAQQYLFYYGRENKIGK